MSLKNKTFLITGGAGSFGQKFVEILLKEYDPRSVRVYDNRELVSVEMERQFNDDRLRYFIGDVRDEERLRRAMEGVDIVVHAAALKHVPICEFNPIEAIKTNIDGSVNVINAALDKNVDKVIAISTDKAVAPVNLYGATKMVAEKLFIQGNSYRGSKNTKLSCTRYGNVIASSGSVIPLFQSQKQSGEITITDERMTRFFITLEDGARFVINCIDKMEGGEIFIPKMPSVKITDLARIVAPECKIKLTGIRPGEKLDEILLTSDESRHAKDFGDYFVVEPEFSFWNSADARGGKNFPEGFSYDSSNNDQWMNEAQVRKILENI
jgi:UDP-N-acetylglucosamine 4,6-dehydratase (inverting)